MSDPGQRAGVLVNNGALPLVMARALRAQAARQPLQPDAQETAVVGKAANISSASASL